MPNDRRWLGLAALVILALGGLLFWLARGPSRDPSSGASGRAYDDPELGSGTDTVRSSARDGGVIAPGAGSNGAGGSREQAETTEGRTDGAVPLVADPPYQSPTEDVEVLSPAELRRRRLEQVALIERSIADLDRQIAESPGTPHRVMLLGRREHLEARRAELLSVVLEEP